MQLGVESWLIQIQNENGGKRTSSNCERLCKRWRGISDHIWQECRRKSPQEGHWPCRNVCSWYPLLAPPSVKPIQSDDDLQIQREREGDKRERQRENQVRGRCQIEEGGLTQIESKEIIQILGFGIRRRFQSQSSKDPNGSFSFHNWMEISCCCCILLLILQFLPCPVSFCWNNYESPRGNKGEGKRYWNGRDGCQREEMICLFLHEWPWSLQRPQQHVLSSLKSFLILLQSIPISPILWGCCQAICVMLDGGGEKAKTVNIPKSKRWRSEKLEVENPPKTNM